MSRHFCCCIPVRAAVFIFSLLSFLSTAALAGLAWYAVYEIQKKANGFTNVTSDGKIIVIVVGCISTLMALLSLFGFVGSITRNRRFVKSYSYMTWALFVLSLVSAGLFEYLVFAGKSLFKECAVAGQDGDVAFEECSLNLSTWLKVVVTLVVLLSLSVHLYIVVIIRRYVEQLEDDDGAWKGMYTLTSTDANQGYHAPSYPYADPAHAYGNA